MDTILVIGAGAPDYVVENRVVECGNTWTANAIKCRFAQLEKKTSKRFFQ